LQSQTQLLDLSFGICELANRYLLGQIEILYPLLGILKLLASSGS
jgi:hypothetical protein